MVSNQQFRLKWNNHRNTVLQEFETLLHNNAFVDCIIGAEGKYLKAHKLVLSACSPYLQNVFNEHFDKHPVILLKDVSFKELKCMIDYMYCGEVNISECELPSFLRTAQSLKIKGLAEDVGYYDTASEDEHSEASAYSKKNRPAETKDEIFEVHPPLKKRTASSISSHFNTSLTGQKRKAPGTVPATSSTNVITVPTQIVRNTSDLCKPNEDEEMDCFNACDNDGNPMNASSVEGDLHKEASDGNLTQCDYSEPGAENVKVEPFSIDEESGDNSNYECGNSFREENDTLNEESESNCANSGNDFDDVNIANVSSYSESANGDARSSGGRSDGDGGGGSGSVSGSSTHVAAHRCFQCSRCSKLFKDGLTLWSHVFHQCRTRSPNVYNCEFCVYKSKWKSNLKRHKIMVHKHLMESSFLNNSLISTSPPTTLEE